MSQGNVRVGFAGLGIMGTGMALNLHSAGFDLTVWNRSPAKATPFTALGVPVAPSVEQLAESVDVLFICLSDTLYAADESVLESDYDFVTATEVIEHVQRPLHSLTRMWRCVKASGYLGLMTKLVIDQAAFAHWHYKNDETHICFYSQETFKWLARQWNTEAVFVGHDVIIFQKPRCSRSMDLSPQLSHMQSTMKDDTTSFRHRPA